MEILQSNLHPQPQEQLEQVAQGCGQLDLKCLHGWRLHTSRDMLQHLIKITMKKKKPFLMFTWNVLYFSSCTLPCPITGHHRCKSQHRQASFTCTGSRDISQALHRKVWEPSSEKTANVFKQGHYKPAARLQS